MIVRNASFLWRKKLSFAFQNSIRSYVKIVGSSDERIDPILSRVTIVDCEKKSKEILESLIKSGDPVGIDVEGTHLPYLSQVQIRSQDRSVYIFPVRTVPQIVTLGCLKEFLENPSVIKVMVGAAGDLRAFYRESIKVWGLYDLDLAYKVMKYQNQAANIFTPPVGLVTLCNEFGLDANFMKNFNEGSHYKIDEGNSELTDSMILYSTLDVEPLLDLYQILNASISEDFVPLLQELNEIDLIRCLDPELSKARKTLLKRSDFCRVHVKNLNSGLSKADLYMAIAHFDGPRTVYLGTDNTAHIKFSNRQQAIVAQKYFTESEAAKQKLGHNIESSLIVDIRHSEVEGINIRGSDLSQQNNKSIIDREKVRELIEIIFQVKSPVALELNEQDGRIFLEIFVGRFPSLKLEITSESIEQNGVAELIGSKEVTKVVQVIDSKSLYSLLRSCAALNHRPQNFFVVSSACLLNDYLKYGSTAFTMSESSTMELGRSLGIFSSSNLETLLYSYLHLSQVLPAAVQDLLSAKTRAELDIASNIFVSEAKEARRQLKIRFESQALHITATQTCSPKMEVSKFESSLKESLLSYMKSMNYEASSYLGYQSQAIVGLIHHIDTISLWRDITNQTFFDQRFQLKASKIGHRTKSRPQHTKAVSLLDLERRQLANIENLDRLDFFRKVQKITEKKNFGNSNDRPNRKPSNLSFNLVDILQNLKRTVGSYWSFPVLTSSLQPT